MKENVLIENVRYVMEKNPEHNNKLSPVIEYLENVIKEKTEGMKRIWYFGTDGGIDHCPKCIKGTMTSEEYSKLCNVDSSGFEKTVCWESGGYISDVSLCGYRFSVYGIPYSVDNRKPGSHTYLFMEGYYTKKKMMDYIKSDRFLRRQFDLY